MEDKRTRRRPMMAMADSLMQGTGRIPAYTSHEAEARIIKLK